MRALTSICVATLLTAAVVTGDTTDNTVWDGVYTEAQAKQGSDVYFDHCAECHADDLSGQSEYKPARPLAGPEFRSRWDGTTLDQLFWFASTRMPKNRPGALKKEEYAAVVAFILQANRFPASTAKLPSDLESLRQLRFLKERAAKALSEGGRSN